MDAVVLLAVLVLHRIASIMGMWPYALFTLIGTLCHEFAHWLMAFLLGASPSFPSLVPERIPGGWRLGSVSCFPTLLSSIPIALAPFALGPVGLWWAATYLPIAQGGWYMAHAWIAGTILMASLPSSQDWRVATPSLLIVALGLAWYSERL